VNPKDTMADDDLKPSDDAQPKEKPKEEGQKEDTPKETWDKIVAGKYKTPEELAQAYRDLESKLGEQGNELKGAREFAETIRPLVELVRDDEELFKVIDEKLRTGKGKEDKGEETKKTDREVRTAASDIIIAQFESMHGINKLSNAEQESLRKAIGSEINDMTGLGLNQIDLRRLPKVLEKAYVLATKDKADIKAKLETQMAANEEGAIPSLSSSPGKETEALTPEEAKVATGMGLTREQYLEGKKKSGR